MSGDNTEAMRLAALGDLRYCLEVAEETGVLERVSGADPHLEIGALYELSLAHAVPPVLLFEDIKGGTPGHRIVTNVRSMSLLNPHHGKGLDEVRAYRRGL
ncbi:MAG TPA: hypothetical protein VLN73_09245, partial [Alphaproteobacteria bacterium]|nr:hypothetical protein [Alphaproteobacteria bacterium]